MWAELDVGFGAEELAEEELQRSFEIGEADAFGHVEPLHLRELGEVGGIDFVAAVGRAGGNNAHRRRAVLHHADLHGRRVRAQEAAIGKVKGVLLVSCRMVGGRVQRVEAMPFGLDIRAIGNRKAHAPEAPNRPVEQLRERMKGSRLWKCPRQGEVERRNGSGIGLLKESDFA